MKRLRAPLRASGGSEHDPTTAPVVAPYRRAAWQECVWEAVLLIIGFTESLTSAWAIAVFVIGVPIGFLAERGRGRTFDPTAVDETPLGSVYESAAGTWIRTLTDLIVIALSPLVIIGVFIPAFGGMAGGFALGLLIETVLTIWQVARREKHYSFRLFYEVPPRWFD